mgnify:CR=1 FL=1
MGWRKSEAVWLFGPVFWCMLEGCHVFERLEPLGEVVGVEELGEVLAQVGVGLAMVAPDCRLLECSVHAFDLSVGLRVIELGQGMIDVEPGAGDFEGMPTEEFVACDGFFDQACG